MKNLYHTLTKVPFLVLAFCGLTWGSVSAQWSDLQALPGLNEGAVAWGDYDGDGDLDFAIGGLDNSNMATTDIYTNEGDTAFTLLSNSGVMPGVGGKDYIAWGDYNNDNQLDLVVFGGSAAGQSGPGQLYRNQMATSNNFFNIFTFPQGVWSSVRFVDIDMDGDQDLIGFGSDDLNDSSIVYINNYPSATFNVFPKLPGINSGSGDVGDYDNDGDLDVLMTGRDGISNNASTRVFRNDGDLVFTEISASFTGLYQSMGKFADLDNDGNLDIVISGYDNANAPTSEVYSGDGNGGFSLENGAGLLPMAYSAFTIGDYDNDGLADIAMIGDSTGNLIPVSRLYTNAGNFTFTDTGADLQPTTQGGIAFGDFDRDEHLDLLMTGLNSPTPAKGFVYRNDAAVTYTELNAGLTDTDDGDVAWGDYNNDGLLDLVITGFSGMTPTTTVYKQAPAGVFSPEPNATGIMQVLYSSVDWGDFNNDGNLDLAVMGNLTMGGIGTNYGAELYTGDGMGNFTPTGDTIIGTHQGAIRFGDYDGDGNLDLVVAGDNGSSTSEIYKGNGSSFTNINAQLPRLNAGDAEWGDYDNDGDLDLLITGQVAFQNEITQIWRYSDTTGTFSNSGIMLPGGLSSNVDWADLDNDGWLDFAWTGRVNTTTYETKIYRQTAPGVFADISAGLEAVRGVVEWGDVNQDGLPDLLVAGYSDNLTAGYTGVYLNQGGTQFMEWDPGFGPANGTAADWGDYNNDGWLDLAIQGMNGQEETKIFTGAGPRGNEIPDEPQNLTATLMNNGASLKFTWDKATDAETASDGLSYQLMIGFQGGSQFGVAPALADTTDGLRYIAERGMIQDTTWTLTGMTNGATYCASVLAIDAGLESSEWSNQTCMLVVVGVNDVEERTLLTAWPNPAREELHVAFEKYTQLKQLQVVNLNGQVMLDLPVNNPTTMDLDISRLTPGMYILRAHDGKTVTNLKFTKQ